MRVPLTFCVAQQRGQYVTVQTRGVLPAPGWATTATAVIAVGSAPPQPEPTEGCGRVGSCWSAFSSQWSRWCCRLLSGWSWWSSWCCRCCCLLLWPLVRNVMTSGSGLSPEPSVDEYSSRRPHVGRRSERTVFAGCTTHTHTHTHTTYTHCHTHARACVRTDALSPPHEITVYAEYASRDTPRTRP